MNTEYVFEGQGHMAKVRIVGVKQERKIEISTEITNNEYVPLDGRLFGRDRDKRNALKLLLMKLPRLKDTEVKAYVLLEFASMGYRLLQEVPKVK